MSLINVLNIYTDFVCYIELFCILVNVRNWIAWEQFVIEFSKSAVEVFGAIAARWIICDAIAM